MTYPAQIRVYRAYCEQFAADAAAVKEGASRRQRLVASAKEALAARDELARTGDVEAFRAKLQAWAKKPQTLDFDGTTSGQMFVNQLVNYSMDHQKLARILTDTLTVPRDDADAKAKIQALVDYIKQIQVRAFPAPGNGPFLLSYFWALEDPDRWPVMWKSVAEFLEHCTGKNDNPTPPVQRYMPYRELIREFDDDVNRFVQVAGWWERTEPVIPPGEGNQRPTITRKRAPGTPSATPPPALRLW